MVTASRENAVGSQNPINDKIGGVGEMYAQLSAVELVGGKPGFLLVECPHVFGFAIILRRQSCWGGSKGNCWRWVVELGE